MDLKFGDIYDVQLGLAEIKKGIYLGKRYLPKNENNWSFLFKDSNGNPEVYRFDLDKSVIKGDLVVIHYPHKKKINPLEKEFYLGSSENSIVKRFEDLQKQ